MLRLPIKIFTIFMMMTLFVTACKSKKRAAQQPSSVPNSGHHQVPRPSSGQPHISIADYDHMEVEPKKNVPHFDSPVEKYIYTYADIAKEEMRLYHIPASITLAQGILESNSGNGNLTRRSNNHFGIKCNGWQGEKVYHDDDAYQECFRKYINPKYSFRDHSLFLAERKRYATLFTYHKDDYKAWAKGLKRAGYATDPRYPQKLISLIERYELYKYDEEVLGKGSRKGRGNKITPAQTDYSSIRYTVKKGDTLYSISKRYGLTVNELKRMNKLRSNGLSVGQKLYVKKH